MQEVIWGAPGGEIENADGGVFIRVRISSSLIYKVGCSPECVNRCWGRGTKLWVSAAIAVNEKSRK